MLDHINLDEILFLDIETVLQTYSYSELNDITRKLWDNKFKHIPSESTENQYKKAGVYAEFSKIICISVGILKNNTFRLKSFFGDEEKKILKDFSDLLSQHYNKKEHLLCAHNGKEFDFPFIARRMLINGQKLNNPLQIKFEDGRIIKIKKVNFKIRKLQNLLEKKTGLIYGHGNLYAQTSGIIEAWKKLSSPQYKLSQTIAKAGSKILADFLAKKLSGFVAVDESGAQVFLVVPIENKDGHVALKVDDIAYHLAYPFFNYLNQFKNVELSSIKVGVELASNNDSLEELNKQLEKARAEENVEWATSKSIKISSRRITTVNVLGYQNDRKTKIIDATNSICNDLGSDWYSLGNTLEDRKSVV